MNRRFLLFGLVFCIFLGIYYFVKYPQSPVIKITNNLEENNSESEKIYPLSIEALRKEKYLGSDVVIERALDDGSNYRRYIASYKSDGYKIYGLLTVPSDEMPRNGWPVIIFNHGFIPPAIYRTTEKYVAYQDGFAKNGYITFKSDYRGHGNSEGEPSGAYNSNAYTRDVLNAVSSIKKLKNPSTGSGSIVNVGRIGMWGHSMGGFLTLRSMVTDPSIKVGVIWAGVVASYPDMLSTWRRTVPSVYPTDQRSWRRTFSSRYGTPSENPQFWKSISATSYLKDISGPLQIHHSTNDEEVPVEFSRTLYSLMKKLGNEAEFYEYPNDDHNISANFNTAMIRSLEYFDKYLK